MAGITISGVAFGRLGGPVNGASVYAWAASRFLTPPGQNALPPAGPPDAGPVISSPLFGGPGAYEIALPASTQYYIQSIFAGVSYWAYIDTSGGGGDIIPPAGEQVAVLEPILSWWVCTKCASPAYHPTPTTS